MSKVFDDYSITLRLLRQYALEIEMMKGELERRGKLKVRWAWWRTPTDRLRIQIDERERFLDSIKLHMNHVERMRRKRVGQGH